MSKLNQLFAGLEETKAPSSGQWYRVQWIPDLLAGEVVNIGAVFIDRNGSVEIQTAQEFPRLDCFLGEKAFFHAKLACDMAVNMVESSQNPNDWSSSHVRIVKAGFAQGNSNDEVLHHLVKDHVTLGKPKVKKKRSRRPTVNRRQVTEKVFGHLYDCFGENTKEIVPENPFVIGEDSGKEFKVYVPIRTSEGVATIASARSPVLDTSSLNIMRAQRDISVVKQMGVKRDHVMHLLLPSESYPASHIREVENEIDSVSFLLQKEGVKFESHLSEKMMAESVINWIPSVDNRFDQYLM